MASTPPPIIASARSFICSDHLRAEEEHRLDGVLLVQEPQVLQEEANCGEEPLGADLRHRERSERLVRDPHRSRVEWDDVSRIPFYKNFDGKWEGHQWRIQREGFGGG